MLSYLQFLTEQIGLPSVVCICVVILLVILNVIGEILDAKNKIVPEFMKLRTHFKNKKTEREETAKILKEVKQHLTQQDEADQTLKEVKQLLADVNVHYSADNIAKRDGWMQWVNDRAEVYDNSIVAISEKLNDATEALRDNTKMTEEMFVENSRDRIIDFAEKVVDPEYIVSHEQFRRIFRVYNDYEAWLAEHGRTNGEVDMNYSIIQDAYAYRTSKHLFAEDLNKYTK